MALDDIEETDAAPVGTNSTHHPWRRGSLDGSLQDGADGRVGLGAERRSRFVHGTGGSVVVNWQQGSRRGGAAEEMLQSWDATVAKKRIPTGSWIT